MKDHNVIDSPTEETKMKNELWEVNQLMQGNVVSRKGYTVSLIEGA